MLIAIVAISKMGGGRKRNVILDAEYNAHLQYA
jgi:hypothetical protein